MGIRTITRIVIAPLIVLYTPKTHRILWQQINQKLGRDAPIAQNAVASTFAWMTGATIGCFLWPKIRIDFPETLWYDIGWFATIWFGGMLLLSLVELFGLWLEPENQDKNE